MADIESPEELNPDTDDDSVELTIKHDGNEIDKKTDFEAAHRVLEKLESMRITNYEELKDYEYSGE